MFCEKCGNEMPDNVKFCPSCGAEQGESKQKTFSGNTVEKKKKNRKPLIIAAAALAVICIAAMLGIAMRKPAISLNQYLTVEFDGAEGYGTASVSIDYEKLISDSRDKMKEADDTLFSSSDLLMFCIDGELDKTDRLSNGDTVTFSWSCNDEEALDSFGVKLKYSDEEFIVEGLEQMETRDLFEYFNVTFSGISPEGEANVSMDISSDYTFPLYYELDKRDGLSNGDVVTLTLYMSGDTDVYQYYAENFGFIPASTEKIYTVEGLEAYVQSSADISDDAMEKMKAQGEDAFTSIVAQSWSEEATVNEISFCGDYLLVNKDPSNYSGAVNQLYLVYHVKSILDYTTVTGDKRFRATPEFYWYILYENLVVGDDGKTIVDVNDYETVNDSFKVTSDNIMNWGSPKAWTYRGYETLDDLKYAVVTTNQEVYNCENNVEAAEHASTPDPGKSVEASECTTEETSKTSADTETATEEN